MSLTDAIRLLHAATLEPIRHRSDAELLRLFSAESDEASFREIVERYEGLVRSTCQRWIRDSHAVDDVVQATFLKLARKAPSIRRPEALPGWLYRVARSIAMRVRPSVPLEIEPLDSAPSPLDQLTAREVLTIFDQELARLPDRYRTVLLLCTLDGLTVDEAAQRLQTTEGAIRGWLQRGRQRLAKRLQLRGIELAVVMPLLWQASSRSEVSASERLVQCALGLQQPSAAVSHLVAGTSLLSIMAVSTLSIGMIGAVLLVANFRQGEEPKQPPSKAAIATPDQLPEGDPLPEGAVARIGSPQLRHAGEIVAVAFSDDNRWLASASTDVQDKTVRLWDLSNGKEKYRFPIEVNPNELDVRQRTASVCFSPDGKQLFFLDRRGFQAIDLSSGKKSVEKQLYDPSKKGGPVYPSEEIVGSGFSPDRKLFAVVRQNKELLLGDTATGEIKTTIAASFNSPPNAFYSFLQILFTPESSEVCVPTKTEPIRIYETATGQSMRNLAANLIPEYGSENNCCFLPGGKLFVSLLPPEDNRKPLYDAVIGEADTGKIVRKIATRGSRCLKISRDAKLLAVGVNPMKAIIYDLENGRELQEAPLHLTPSLLAFSPDSRLFVGLSHHSGEIALWDVEKKASHPYAADGISYAKFDQQGHIRYGTHIRQRTIDWRTGKVLLDEEILSDKRGSIESPDGKLLAEVEIKMEDAKRTLSYLIKNKKNQEIAARLKGLTSYPKSACFADQNRVLITVTQDSILSVWDIASEKLVWAEQYPARAFGLVGTGHPYLDGKNRRLAICSAGNNSSFIDVWELSPKKKIVRIEVPSPVLSSGITISNDGNYVAAGNQALSYWRVSDGKLVHRLEGHQPPESRHDRGGIHGKFSLDGRKLLTVDPSGTIRIWEFATGKLIRTFAGHQGQTYASFSPDSRLILGMSPDAPIYIWDVYGIKTKTPFDGDSLWKALADENADKAFAAVCQLCASPKEALGLLKAKLPPDTLDQKVIDQFLADLASERFAVREKASAELEKLSERIEPYLRKSLPSITDEEVRQRLSAILENTEKFSPSKLQTLRALDALEHLGTPEAKQYLETLSKGSSYSTLTQQAKEALARLSNQ